MSVRGVLRHKNNESVSMTGELIATSGAGNIQFRVDGALSSYLFAVNDGFYFEPNYNLPTKDGLYVEHKSGLPPERLTVYYRVNGVWRNPEHGDGVHSLTITEGFKRRKAVLRRLDFAGGEG